MIVAIRKDQQILLAYNERFPGAMHSILAGFVIPGESLENTIIREVKEEAGIEIKNIKYFGSQPWAFPNSLMLGFTAEYSSGNLVPDGEEVDHLEWYNINQLPPIPPPLSIARQLIDWTINQIVTGKK
jgi:NAD+ diphosphatase